MAEFPAGLLILDDKSTDNLPLHGAIMLLREEGMTIHVQVTWKRGNAMRFVEGARKLGITTMIADGGDGTVNEVSTALIQCEGNDTPALGILPLRTANGFATSVGIPEALDKALKLTIADNTIAIDMAQINKQTCFINIAAGRFETRITTKTPEKLKAVLGGVSYIIHGLICMDTPQPDRCEVHNENFRWQDGALVIGIDNGRQAGDGRQLCSNALISDDLLQLRIFADDEIIPTLVSTLESDEDNPNIIEDASSWFDMQAPYEITFNLDGKPLSEQNFRIEILSAVLRCRLPPDCPLLR